jgi:hypothetical protein
MQQQDPFLPLELLGRHSCVCECVCGVGIPRALHLQLCEVPCVRLRHPLYPPPSRKWCVATYGEHMLSARPTLCSVMGWCQGRNLCVPLKELFVWLCA